MDKNTVWHSSSDDDEIPQVCESRAIPTEVAVKRCKVKHSAHRNWQPVRREPWLFIVIMLVISILMCKWLNLKCYTWQLQSNPIKGVSGAVEALTASHDSHACNQSDGSPLVSTDRGDTSDKTAARESALLCNLFTEPRIIWWPAFYAY